MSKRKSKTKKPIEVKEELDVKEEPVVVKEVATEKPTAEEETAQTQPPEEVEEPELSKEEIKVEVEKTVKAIEEAEKEVVVASTSPAQFTIKSPLGTYKREDTQVAQTVAVLVNSLLVSETITIKRVE